MSIDDLPPIPPPHKPKRQQKKGRPSKTKPKGSPVVGRQAETLFGAKNGNTPGVTSAQKKAAYRAAELAQIATTAWLENLVKLVNAEPDKALQHLDNTRLALVNSAQDRGFGKAQSSLDVTSSDGSARLPSVIQLVGPDAESDE